MKKILNLFFILLITSCQQEESIHLKKKVIKSIYPAIVEVVIPKQEDKDIVYQRPLPFDQLDFKERNDKYHAIGTAFFINDTKLISAAHVFPVEEFSTHGEYFIRTATGEVHALKTIYRYSTYRDLIEFDLKSYPNKVTSLQLNKEVEIGDMVYAVGNAQGEGISTRGGQVSTFTPEPVEGKWNYIRFSSPASPGNSGGPLVNYKGEVVGVIVMKNNSENLNYALPVSEISSASLKSANFFERKLKVQDGMQILTKDWQFQSPLPATFKELRKASANKKHQFYGELIREFKKKNEKLLFPYNPRYRDSLLNQSLYPNLSILEKDTALHNWYLDPIKLKKISVSKENILYHSKGEVFEHYILFKKEKGAKLLTLFKSPRLLLNRILKASGAHRRMASQRIPIEDYGAPDEEEMWKDRLGRSWMTSHWLTQYNNTIFSLHCTPTPEGIICFLDHNYASQKLQGYMHFVKENILEINLSYKGSVEEWLEFLKLPKELIPRFLKDFSLAKSKNSISISTKYWNLKNLNWSSPGQGPINVLISYDPSQKMAMTIHGLEVISRKTPEEGFLLIKAHEVSELASDEAIDRWENLINKEGPFNGAVQQRGDELRLRKLVGPRSKVSLLQQSARKSVKAQWILSCFSPLNSLKKQLSKRCAKTSQVLSFP